MSTETTWTDELEQTRATMPPSERNLADAAALYVLTAGMTGEETQEAARLRLLETLDNPTTPGAWETAMYWATIMNTAIAVYDTLEIAGPVTIEHAADVREAAHHEITTALDIFSDEYRMSLRKA